MTSTPTAAMEVLLSLRPIELFTRQAADVTVARLFESGQWLAHGRNVGHVGILNTLMEEWSGKGP